MSTLSGNITHSISDLYKRNFEKFDNNKLKEHLLKIDWINEILKNGDGINKIFATFYKSLNEIVDRHAPLTKATKKALDKSRNQTSYVEKKQIVPKILCLQE